MDNETENSVTFSRRDFIKAAGVIAGSAVLAACAPGEEAFEGVQESTRLLDLEGIPDRKPADLRSFLFEDQIGTLKPGDIVHIEIRPELGRYLNFDPSKTAVTLAQFTPEGKLVPIGALDVDAPIVPDKTFSLGLSDSPIIRKLLNSPEVGLYLKTGDLTTPIFIESFGQKIKLGGKEGVGDFQIKLIEARLPVGMEMIAAIYDPEGNFVTLTNKIAKGHLPKALREGDNHYRLRHTGDLKLLEGVVPLTPQNFKSIVQSLPAISTEVFSNIAVGQSVEILGVELKPKAVFTRKGYQMVLIETITDGKPTGYSVMTMTSQGQTYNYGFMADLTSDAFTGANTSVSELQAYRFLLENVKKEHAKGREFTVEMYDGDGWRTSYHTDLVGTETEVKAKIKPIIERGNGRLYSKLLNLARIIPSVALELVDILRPGLIYYLIKSGKSESVVDAIGMSAALQMTDILGSTLDTISTEFDPIQLADKSSGKPFTIVYNMEDTNASTSDIFARMLAQDSLESILPHFYILDNTTSHSPVRIYIEPNRFESFEKYSWSGDGGREKSDLIDESPIIEISYSHADPISKTDFAQICQNAIDSGFSNVSLPEGYMIDVIVTQDSDGKSIYLFTTNFTYKDANGINREKVVTYVHKSKYTMT